MVTPTILVDLEKIWKMGGHDCAHALPGIQKHTRLPGSTEVAGASKATEGNSETHVMVHI